MTDDQIESLVRSADLAEIFKAHGVRVARTGNLTRALCPFHDDHDPSLNIYPDSGRGQRFHCFACGAHGDAVDLVRVLRGTDFRGAVEWLAARKGVTIQWGGARSAKNRERLPTRDEGLALAYRAFAEQTDDESESLGRWLASRSLDLSGIDGVEVFWSPAGKVASRDWTRPQREALSLAGVAYFSSGDTSPTKTLATPSLWAPKDRDFFRRARVIFPLVSRDGALCGFAARATEPADHPKYLYTKGFERSAFLYGLDRVVRAALPPRGPSKAASSDAKVAAVDLYIVEGLVDVLRLSTLGILAVGVLGSSISAGQVQLLAELGERLTSSRRELCVHLFLDSDEAGQRGSLRSLVELLRSAADHGNFRVDVVIREEPTTKAKDPDELLMRDTPAEAQARLRRMTISPAEAILGNAIGVTDRGVAEAWSKVPDPDRPRARHLFARTFERREWPRILDGTTFFDATAKVEPSVGPAIPWGEIEAFVRGQGTTKANPPRGTPDAPEMDKTAALWRAARLARAATSHREVPVDEARWERLLRAPDLFGTILSPFLREGARPPHLEPLLGARVPKSDGKTRLKAMPCPEDSTVQQYLLLELLKDIDSQPAYAQRIPAVRFDSSARGPRTRTTGATLSADEASTVSFAYQIDMATVNGIVAPRKHGIFRPYRDCWNEYIQYVRDRIERMRSEQVFLVRVDIHGFYDNIRRDTVLSTIGPRMREAFKVFALDDDQTAPKVAPLFRMAEPAEERAGPLVDVFARMSFDWTYYDPADGKECTSPGKDVGIPQGPDLSAYLATVALFDVDEAMRVAVRALDGTSASGCGGVYARYVDDIYLGATTSEGRRLLKATLERELEKIGLRLSAEKTHVFADSNPVEVLATLALERVAMDASATPGPHGSVGVEATLYPLLDAGMIDRRTAMGFLRDERLEDLRIGMDRAQQLLAIALRGRDLRHGEWASGARIAWRLAANGSDVSNLSSNVGVDVQSLVNGFVKHWTDAAVDFPRTTPVDRVAEVIAVLDGLERVLSRRDDLSPMRSDGEANRLAQQRRLLAQAIQKKLVPELLRRFRDLPPLATDRQALGWAIGDTSGQAFEPTSNDESWGVAFQMSRAHYALYWRAANIVPLTDQRPGVHSSNVNKTAFDSYFLGALEASKRVTAEEGAGGYDGKFPFGHEMSLAHRLVAILRGAQSAQGSAADDRPTEIRKQLTALSKFVVSTQPTLVERVVRSFVDDDSAAPTTSVDPEAHRLALVTLFGVVDPGSACALLSFCASLRAALAKQFSPDEPMTPIPMLPGVREPWMLWVAGKSEGFTGIVAVRPTDDVDARPALPAEFTWTENEPFSIGDVGDKAAFTRSRGIYPEVRVLAFLANGATLGLNDVATLFQTLVDAQEIDQEKDLCAVPFAGNVVDPGKTGDGRALVVASRVPARSVAGVAFRASKERGLSTLSISTLHAPWWRAGYALMDVLGIDDASSASFESIRMALEKKSREAPRDALLRMTLHLLRGPEWLTRRLASRPLSEEYPPVIKRALERLRQFAGSPEPQAFLYVLESHLDLAKGLALEKISWDSATPGAVSYAALEFSRRTLSSARGMFEEQDEPHDSSESELLVPRGSLAYHQCAEHCRQLLARAECANSESVVVELAAGYEIAALTFSLQSMVLAGLAEARANDQLAVVAAFNPLLSEWGLDDECLLRATTKDAGRVTQSSPRDGAHPVQDRLAALRGEPEEAESSRARAFFRHLTGIFGSSFEHRILQQEITPLGWCVAAAALFGGISNGSASQASSRTVDASGPSGMDPRGVFSRIAQRLAWTTRSSSPDSGNSPPDLQDALTEFASSDNSSLDVEGTLRELETIRASFKIRRTVVRQQVLEMVRRDAGMLLFRVATGERVELLPAQLVVASSGLRGDTKFEELPASSKGEGITFIWEEYRGSNGRVLAISFVERDLSEAAWPRALSKSATSARMRPSAEAGTSTEKGPASPIRENEEASNGFDRAAESAAGTEPAHLTGTARSATPAPPPASVAAGDRPETQSPASGSTDGMPPDDGLVQSFRDFQAKSWEARMPHTLLPVSQRVRIALFQFDVDDSYRHPEYELCRRQPEAKPSGMRGERYSCAEYRRQKLLTAVLNACEKFKVEVLVLPELSTRPETVTWLRERTFARDITVWAGTYRLPPGTTPSKGDEPSKDNQTYGPIPDVDWGTVVPVVASRDVPASVATDRLSVLSRWKKYAAPGPGEWFRPPPRSEDTFRAVTTSWGRASKQEKSYAFAFLTELVCSEVFLTASPANLIGLATDLERLRRYFTPSNNGNPLKDIKDDIVTFAMETTLERSRIGRRSILVVPAMTSRSDDYVFLGQSLHLSAAMTTVFCGAVAGAHGTGQSCFIGFDSTKLDGDGEAGVERIGPYHGVEPGKYTPHSREARLGKEEQAVLIADVDPIYQAEGKPRPQTLLCPLHIVAHLPVLERWAPPSILKVADGLDEGDDTAGEPSRSDRLCACLPKSSEECRCVRSSKMKKRLAVKATAGKPDPVDPRGLASAIGTFLQGVGKDMPPSTTGLSRKNAKDCLALLERLAELEPDSPSLRARAKAFSQNYQRVPSAFPPPALVDWIDVLMGEPPAGERSGFIHAPHACGVEPPEQGVASETVEASPPPTSSEE